MSAKAAGGCRSLRTAADSITPPTWPRNRFAESLSAPRPTSLPWDAWSTGSSPGSLHLAHPRNQRPGNAAIRARLEQVPVPPSIARGGDTLPAWVDDVVLGALERDPRLRYGSAGSFAAVFHAGVEGETDVETGRPRGRVERPSSRQFPNNEPGIAVKGSPILATRRGTSSPVGTGGSEDGRRNLCTAHHQRAGVISLRTPIAKSDLEVLGRRLWQAVILAAVAECHSDRGAVDDPRRNSRVTQAGEGIRPGASVRIAGAGLVARAAPDTESAIVADLPDGGTVLISGEPVQGDGGLWWPIEVDAATGFVNGYVPESWVQAP